MLAFICVVLFDLWDVWNVISTCISRADRMKVVACAVVSVRFGSPSFPLFGIGRITFHFHFRPAKSHFFSLHIYFRIDQHHGQ